MNTLVAVFATVALVATNTGAPAPAPMNPITGEWEDPATYLGPEDYAFYKEYVAAQQEETYQETWFEPESWQEPTWETGGWFDPWGAPNQYVQVGNHYAGLAHTNEQWAVDAAGTAAMFDYGGKTVIADHAAQGFKAIRWNNTADICGHRYRKVSEYIGYNDGYDMYAGGVPAYAVPDGEVIMYTCLDGGGYNIAVTYWTAE